MASFRTKSKDYMYIDSLNVSDYIWNSILPTTRPTRHTVACTNQHKESNRIVYKQIIDASICIMESMTCFKSCFVRVTWKNARRRTAEGKVVGKLRSVSKFPGYSTILGQHESHERRKGHRPSSNKSHPPFECIRYESVPSSRYR